MTKENKRGTRKMNDLVGDCPYCDGKRRAICDCGANNACDKCGRGAGQSSCDCRPVKNKDGELRWGKPNAKNEVQDGI